MFHNLYESAINPSWSCAKFNISQLVFVVKCCLLLFEWNCYKARIIAIYMQMNDTVFKSRAKKCRTLYNYHTFTLDWDRRKNSIHLVRMRNLRIKKKTLWKCSLRSFHFFIMVFLWILQLFNEVFTSWNFRTHTRLIIRNTTGTIALIEAIWKIFPFQEIINAYILMAPHKGKFGYFRITVKISHEIKTFVLYMIHSF